VYVYDFQIDFGVAIATIDFLHYENAFRNTNNLASHKVASYNHFHWLSLFDILRMSPPPSSFGGLNPNRSFGFFFVLVRPLVRQFGLSGTAIVGPLEVIRHLSLAAQDDERKTTFLAPVRYLLRLILASFDSRTEFPL
jgi:hypothetical protein